MTIFGTHLNGWWREDPFIGRRRRAQFA